MLPAERKQKILRYVKDKKAATIQDLSAFFNVHEATIRRDLSELEKSKKLFRTHGGVVLNEEEVVSEPHVDKRKTTFVEEKRNIAIKAASFIEDGDTIILDSGTTTEQIAYELNEKKNITVITNDVHIAALLRKMAHKVIVTGGILYPESFVLNGDITNQTLSNVNVTKAFIATPALHPDKGLTHFDETFVSAKRSMILAATEVFVVTDHSKMGKVSTYNFARMNEIDHIITSSTINNTYIEEELRSKCENLWIVSFGT